MAISCISVLMSDFRKPVLFLLLVLQVYWWPAAAQEHKTASMAHQLLSTRGEVIIRFVKPNNIEIAELTRFLSIDNYSGDTITAYANRSGFNRFLELHIPFEVIQPHSLKKTSSSTGEALTWAYPAYGSYISLMQQYASTYPDLCRLHDFGSSVNGHRLLALKISDNPLQEENEPVIFYTASMHGDEPLGYVLMLQLIDSLLTGYNSSNFLKQLIDGAEIWINPIANPDGAYFISDLSVEGGTRFNSNQVDLNRDFPVIGSASWDTIGRQPETIAMLRFLDEIRPLLSANFHSGVEVVNYPWDSWVSKHADDSWYKFISHGYADTAQAHSPPGYMDFMNDGITRGIEWYEVYGGRQDFVNYYLNGREVTIELSDNKIPLQHELDDYWKYNRHSLLHFMSYAFTGFKGIVTDSATGEPLSARIRLLNYDYDNSFVFSKSDGNYFRLLNPGTYKVVITAPGYKYKLTEATVQSGELTPLDAELSKDFELSLFPNPFGNYVKLNIPYSGYNLEVTFINQKGQKIRVVSHFVRSSGPQEIPVGELSPGFYIIHVRYNDQTWNLTGIKFNH